MKDKMKEMKPEAKNKIQEYVKTCEKKASILSKEEVEIALQILSERMIASGIKPDELD